MIVPIYFGMRGFSWLKRWVATAVVGAALTGAVSAETLRLRADSWMPYNGDPEASAPGFAVELAKAVFEPHGIKVDYQIQPWCDALKAAREGKADAVIGAGIADAEGLTLPQESIGEPRIVLLVRGGSTWQYENIRALRSVRLGVLEGYTYWDALDEYINSSSGERVVTFSGEAPLADALRALRDNKIDALPEVMSVFVWTVKGMGLSPSDFRIAHIHQNDPIYIAFSGTAEGKKYAALFDDGVRAMRASGAFQALLKRYAMPDWK